MDLGLPLLYYLIFAVIFIIILFLVFGLVSLFGMLLLAPFKAPFVAYSWFAEDFSRGAGILAFIITIVVEAAVIWLFYKGLVYLGLV